MNIGNMAYSILPGGGRSYTKAQEELLEKLTDPTSGFYGEMTAQILERAQKLEEEKKKQATIDALGEMLDSLSGKNDDESQNGVRETQNGVALGMNADQENTFQKGFMPLELQVYLRNLGVSGAFEALEPDEDQEVQEPEKTEGVNEVQSPEEAVAELAKEYNPRHMSRDEFQSFMDALAESGAMSPEAVEKIRNAGQWVVTVQDQYGNTVEPLAWKENGGTPADSRVVPFLFGEYSMGGDVLTWARLGSADSDFRDLADILSQMEAERPATDHLYAGSAERKRLDRNAVAELADKYDPHNMDRESYDAFLDDLVEAGVISREETWKLGYGGMIRVKLDDMTAYTHMGPLDSGFERAPGGTDILGWLNNRMLWKPETNTPLQRAMASREEAMLSALSSVLNGMERQREQTAII